MQQGYSILARVSLPFVCHVGPTCVPEKPGDDATLLPRSIMNEGGPQPAHSSLPQCWRL